MSDNKEEKDDIKEEEKEVVKSNYNRLEYEKMDDDFVLINNDKNKNILNKKRTTKKLSKLDILDLLSNYKHIPKDKIKDLKMGNKKWYRYLIKGLNGKYSFRRGGFLIHKDLEKEFVVLVNVSQHFSFSVNLKKAILFESLTKKNRYKEEIKKFIKKYFTNRDDNGNILVFINEDFDEIKSFKTMTSAIKDGIATKSGLRKALRNNKYEYKSFLLNKVSDETLKNLTRDFEELDIKKLFTNDEFEKIKEIIDNHIEK